MSRDEDVIRIAVCLLSIFLSTEQIFLNLLWHVYQNEGNVDQSESYLAEVRILNLTEKVSMRNSSNTTRTINKQKQFVSF